MSMCVHVAINILDVVEHIYENWEVAVLVLH